jgi:hypothetical protein
MSAVFCLDTALLAIPSYAANEEEAEGIILRLKHWADIAMRFGHHRVARSEKAEDDLGALGFFPGIDNVRDLIEFNGLQGVYDAQTVWTAYNTILTRSGILSDILGFELDAVESVMLDPNILDGCTPAALKSSTESLLGTLSVANDLCALTPRIFSPAARHEGTKVKVELVANSSFGSAKDQIDPLPRCTKGDVYLARYIEDISLHLSALDLWRSAGSGADVHFAILIRMLELRRAAGEDPSIGDLPSFVVGSEFVASLKAHGAWAAGPYSSVALETCARAILGTPKEPLSPFGKPTQVERDRDKAKALRTHITSKGVGLRLMGWQQANGSIELANIGPKFELVIHEGCSGQAYCLKPIAP